MATDVKRAVLIVDDEEITRRNLSHVFKKEHYRVETSADGKSALKILQDQVFDVVLVDLKMEGMNGMEVLERVKKKWPDVEVIVITGYASLDSAIEAIKKGAYDYIAKPFKFDEVKLTVSKAIEKRGLLEENKRLRQDLKERYRFAEIVGKSRKMQDVFELISRVATTEANVLISGEAGTGKELAARAIHYRSRRQEKPFISVTCGALSEELLADELFGHEKGAFAGIDAMKTGLLEAADGGTIFLDEITETTAGMQVKLLRFLEDGEIKRLGGDAPIKLDVRVIAATDRNPRRDVQKGRLRQDLFYRLGVMEISMPSLYERRDDIPLLALHFLEKYCREQRKEISGISEPARDILKNYDYPGNVRELERIMERAVVLADGDLIEPSHLPAELAHGQERLRKARESELPSLEEQEKQHIERALKSADYNRARTAEILGLDRSTLWRKMKKYGL